MAEPTPYPGMPRWVKVLGIVVLVAVVHVLVVRLALGGELHGAHHRGHGPAQQQR